MPIGSEREYRLRWMDFDRYGCLQPHAILDIFQDIATIQAIEMGISDTDLKPKGVFWVVTRIKLEIVKQPRIHECVRVRTWPHTQTKLSFLRDYSMHDSNGKLIAKATSEWVLVSYEKRSFVSALLAYDGPKDFDETRAFESKPKKIKDFADEPTASTHLEPGNSDIDKNGHVNNAMYARFVSDALPAREGHSIVGLQIDYRREVLAGRKLTLDVLEEESASTIRGLNEDGQIAFMARAELA